jgi:hypothetical protein
MWLTITRSDWAGYSSTIIAGRREIGDINPIFGHYGVRSGYHFAVISFIPSNHN